MSIQFEGMSPRERHNLLAIADDLDFISSEWKSDPDDHALRRVCVILRKLLMDGALASAWRQLGFDRAPQVVYLTVLPHVIEDFGDTLSFALPGGYRGPQSLHKQLFIFQDPGDVSAEVRRELESNQNLGVEVTTSIEQFVESAAMVCEGIAISRRQVISYIAYRRFGIHPDDKKHDENEGVYELLDRLSIEGPPTILVLGRHPVATALLAIGQVLLDSPHLRQLRDVITGASDRGQIGPTSTPQRARKAEVQRELLETYPSLRSISGARRAEVIEEAIEAVVSVQFARTEASTARTGADAMALIAEVKEQAERWYRRSASTPAKVFHILYSLCSGSTLAKTRNSLWRRAAQAGLLFPAKYEVDIDRHFSSKRFIAGVEYVDLNATLRFPDGLFSARAPLDASLAYRVSLFFKKFSDPGFQRFAVVVVALRDDTRLLVLDAFRIFDDMLSKVTSPTGHDVVALIPTHFGVEWLLGDGDWQPLIVNQSAAFTPPLVHAIDDWRLPPARLSDGLTAAAGYVHFTVLQALEPFDGGVRWNLPLVYAVDYAAYANYLRMHGIEVEFDTFDRHSRTLSTPDQARTDLRSSGYLTEHHVPYSYPELDSGGPKTNR